MDTLTNEEIFAEQPQAAPETEQPQATPENEPDVTPPAPPAAVPPPIPTPEEPRPTPEEVARMVAEAESRGYLRGRNEQIEKLMAAPDLWEDLRRVAQERRESQQIASGFLATIRPGVWD